MSKILVLDNYDSFTYNLVHAIENITGEPVDVYRNDEIKIAEIEKYDKIVLSPGPGLPDEAGILKELIKKYSPAKNIFGVCLGLQAITEVFGGKLINLHKVYHGVNTPVKIIDKEELIFKNIPEVFEGGRYHSWVADKNNFPDCLKITAVDDEGIIMAISHKQYKVKAVQFHPESILTKCGNKIIENWLKT